MESAYGHKIWWDEKDQVVRAVGGGEADEKSARWFLEVTQQMAEQHGDGLDWILDLSGITSTTTMGRRILAEASGHPSVRKYAMVGASTLIRTVANFIISLSSGLASRHFATDQEALDWIKGSRS